MAYVGFDDRGYEYFDEGHYPLFYENNSHEYLFDYVAQDLSCLPVLFDQYISRRMSIVTFALFDCPDDDPSIEQMKKVLVDAHPYYKHEVREVLIRAIGRYFNRLLLYSCYQQHTATPDFSEAWYSERIIALLKPLLELGDTYPRDFYNEYQTQIGEDTYTVGHPSAEIETFLINVPQEMPMGFNKELQTQKEISNMLYFLLDISAQKLDELTTPQRIWLYSKIIANSGTEMTVSKRFSFERQTPYRECNNDNQSAESNHELDNMFHSLYSLGKSNVGRDGIPTDIEETLHTAIDYAKTVTVAKPYEEYEINSIRQLLYLEILSMLQDKVMIRKCRHCGKYFVVANRRIAYCDRIDGSGMRCSAIGSQQSFQKKMESDEALLIYNRAYKTHHARVRKGIMNSDAFQLWYSEAKLKLSEVRSGKLDIDSFQKWLKK